MLVFPFSNRIVCHMLFYEQCVLQGKNGNLSYSQHTTLHLSRFHFSAKGLSSMCQKEALVQRARRMTFLTTCYTRSEYMLVYRAGVSTPRNIYICYGMFSCFILSHTCWHNLDVPESACDVQIRFTYKPYHSLYE